MAYTIIKSDGTVLTTIPDGTMNTTSTSLGLPGRNFAGYGSAVDTNFVHQAENYADSTPPAWPLRGQLWYNTNDDTLNVCPTDGESNALAWLTLTSTASGGTTTFGEVTVTGNIQANNINATNNSNANAATFSYLTVYANANIADGNLTTANIGTLTTRIITTGSAATTGTLTGQWSVAGGPGGALSDAMLFTTGGIAITNSGGANLYGIKTDKYMYANGDPISFAGTYSNANVASYLPTYVGQVGTGASTFYGTALTTGLNTTQGNITGNWTLTSGSKLNASYADLAERFAADAVYDAGTVVQLGGYNEITAVKEELSDEVFGVISDSPGFTMNAGAGSDKTHPAVAISGRIKVKVIGLVKLGQRLVSAGNGVARGAVDKEATAFNTIGRALVNKDSGDIDVVEAFVIIR